MPLLPGGAEGVNMADTNQDQASKPQPKQDQAQQDPPQSKPEPAPQDPPWAAKLRDLENMIKTAEPNAQVRQHITDVVGEAMGDMKEWVRREIGLAARGVSEKERAETHNP